MVNDLQERIIEYLRSQHSAGGLHDVTVARDLDEDLASVSAALRKLRDDGHITGKDVRTLTSDGVMSMTDIQLVDGESTSD